MRSPARLLYIGRSTELYRAFALEHQLTLLPAGNILEAVNLLDTETHPDVIICDYYLPGQNGLFLFDWIRERPAYNKIPFIITVPEFNAELFKTAFQKKTDDFYVISNRLPDQLIDRIHFLRNYRSQLRETNVEINPPVPYRMPWSKRLFDIVVASVILLLISPILLLVMLAIRLESKGKVYYISKRVGRKTFDFYKLRSMRTGADSMLKKLAKERNQYNNNTEAANTKTGLPCPRCMQLTDGSSCSPMIYIDSHETCEYWYHEQKKEAQANSAAFVKIVDDPRITRVGKFIRNTSIDELPQLIDVLKGDMSIVGNRPLPVYEAELLTVDALSKRFLAPAGITGLWQVELRGKGGNMSEAERKSLDNQYADHFQGKNYSFWYDMQLILRTIPALLQKGAV